MKNTKSKKLRYSLVIPALKEEPVIGSTLRAVHKFLKKEGVLDVTEVIVVAAEGGDETAKIAHSFSKKFPQFQVIEPGAKVGKGRDVRLGILAARGSYIIFTDADLATPLEHVKLAWDKLEDNADVVIGVRNLRIIHKGYRALVSVAANMLTRVIVLPTIPDTQCGFKGFRRDVAHDIFSTQQIDGWGFDIEVLAIAKKRRYRLEKLFIHNWKDPKLESGLVGESGLKAVTSTLRELLKIRSNLFKGAYNRQAD